MCVGWRQMKTDEDTKDQPHSLIHNHNYSGFSLRIRTREAPRECFDSSFLIIS